MTRRERLERRLERRQEWAASRDRKATAAFEGARRIADNIPLGQPILVGHHSERHARKDQERIHNGMSKGVECSKMAEHHRSKAGGLEHALETSIYSDDPDAIEQLEAKVAALKEQREGIKTSGATLRRAKLRLSDPDTPAKLAELVKAGAITREMAKHAIETAQMYQRDLLSLSSYILTNLGGNIRRCEERIKIIRARQQRTAEAEAAGGVRFKMHEGGYLEITWAEKPERWIIDALKAAGYHWSSGSWYGKLEAFPEKLREEYPDAPRPADSKALAREIVAERLAERFPTGEEYEEPAEFYTGEGYNDSGAGEDDAGHADGIASEGGQE